jgi:transcriptional regulator with XRE-family HTH domain
MPATPPTRFGTLLRTLRLREGLSQGRLGSYLHVDRSTISRLETGSKKPPDNATFYERLQAVPGFSDTDIKQLREARESDNYVEEERKSLTTRLQPTNYLQIAEPLEIWTVINGVWTVVKFAQSLPDNIDSDIISALMASKEVELGDHLPSPTPEQGDPGAAQGTNARGREQPSRRERRRKPARPEQAGQRQGVIFDSRHVDLFNAALRDPNHPNRREAEQAMRGFARAVEKPKGMSIRSAARELNVPQAFLWRWTKQMGIIPVLAEGSGSGSDTLIDREKAQEVSEIYREAKQQRIQPIKLYQRKYPDQFQGLPKI